MWPLIFLLLIREALARFEEIGTGEGTWLRVESDDVPFELEQPYDGRVNIKFGDESNPFGQQSMSFFHGGSYISVVNKGGVKMQRDFDGDFCSIRLKDCECGPPRRERFMSQAPAYNKDYNEPPQVYQPQAPARETYQTLPENYDTTQAPYQPPEPTYNDYNYNTKRPKYTKPRTKKGHRKSKYRPIPQNPYSWNRQPPAGNDQQYSPPAPARPRPRPRPEPKPAAYYTDNKAGEPIYRRVPLAPGHDLNIHSIVDFDTNRVRDDCVDLVVQKPRDANLDASFNNQVFRYFSVLINITNYSPEPVMIYRDVENVECNIGVGDTNKGGYEPKMKRRPYMKTYPTTTTTTTTTQTTTQYIRPYLPERSIQSQPSKGYDYEGKVDLENDYSINFECSVPYQVYRPTRYDVTITLGYDGGNRPQSYKNARFGRYNVDCINYSPENLDFSQIGTRATCRVGQPRYERQSHFGIRRRLFNLDEGMSFEIVGDGDWEVQQNGDQFLITIGQPPYNGMPLTKSHSEYTFGRYTIVIDNYTLKYFTLEQINNRLQCYIGINQRR